MIVYDVVLLPPQNVTNASIAVSQKLQAEGTKFTLNSDDKLTHLSLFMANFTLDALHAAQAALTDIAQATQPLPLAASGYTHDQEQGMFEITYQNTKEATALQTAIITALAPLRNGLREKDPVGRSLADYVPTTGGELRENFDTFGYDEIGGFFRPHITFTRFSRYDHETDITALPPAGTFSCTFTTLALCEMGENGTCSRVVASWELGA
jgi:hypothetical protein